MNTDDPEYALFRKRERELADEDAAAIDMTTTCDAHGKRSWKGDVFCSACGRLHDIRKHDRGDGIAQTVFCRCAEILITNDPELHAKSTARTLCYNCARHYKKRHAGRVPRDRMQPA